MQYISDLEFDFGTASSWSQSVTIPTGARKAVLTLHIESTSPPSLSSSTLDGVSLAVVNDGSTSGTATQTDVRTTIWHVDLTAGNEGASKTFAGTLSGGASVKTRASLAFFDEQGNVGEVQVFNGTVNGYTFTGMNYTAPAVAVMAHTAHANLGFEGSGSIGAGQTAYFNQSASGDASAVASYEEFASGTSDDQSLDGDGTGTRRIAAVCVTFNQSAADRAARVYAVQFEVPLPLPGVPTSVACSPGIEQNTVTWTDPANIALIFLQVNVNSGGWEPLASIDAGVESYTHTGLTVGATYQYRAASQGDEVSTSGTSDWSTPTSGCVPLSPDRSARVYAAQFDAPDFERAARVYAAQLDVPDFERAARVYAFQAEVPELVRAARVYAVQLEVPDAGRRARVYAVTLTVVPPNTSGHSGLGLPNLGLMIA